MLAEVLEQTITNYLPNLKNSRKGWKTRNCPLCVQRGYTQDKKGRFGVKLSPDGIGINCFNCQFHALWTVGTELSKDFCWFLTAIGMPKADVNKLKFQSFREKEAGQIFASPVLAGNVFDKWKEIELPEDSLPLSSWEGCTDMDYLQAVKYANERHLSLGDIYWSPKKELQQCKRIIIPFYYNGKLVGNTGRYYKDVHNKTIRRYINTMPDNYVYNLDKQKDDRKYCIVNEGVLDAYLTDGVSSLGTINKTQIDIINSLNKQIVVCPDRDKDGDPLVAVAIENKWAVAFPKWANNIKDAGQACQVYGRLITLHSILSSIETNPLKINILRKMDNYNEQ